MTERALDKAQSMPRDELIDLAIHLGAPPFAFESMQGADEDRRRGLIADRQARINPSQDAIAASVARIGGEVLGRMWLVNTVDVRVPAGRVAEIAAWANVEAVSVDEDARSLGPVGWNGGSVRAGVLLDESKLYGGKKDFYDGCALNSPHVADPAACHDANTNARISTSPTTCSGAALPLAGSQRIAIIELAGFFGRNHVGYLDGATGTSRVVRVYSCNPTCACSTATTSLDGHGPRVVSIAAGSIEQGQDPNYPLSSGQRTAAQRMRSGIAKEAAIYYYASNGTISGVRYALQQAVSDGADVINMSLGTPGTCSQSLTYDNSGVNAALRNALNSGALPVAAAGNNDNIADTCTVEWPALRPQTLSVGALASYSDTLPENMYSMGIWSGDSDPECTPYPCAVGTARGGATLQIMGSGVQRSYSGIDLVAPGCPDLWFNNDSNGYGTTTNGHVRCGTSYAAPVVSGTAALLRDALRYVGWTAANDAKTLLVNMLLFGDAWDSDGNSKRTSGLGEVTGYGRVRAHYPSSSTTSVNLTAPWGWGTRATTIHEGDVLEWTVWTEGPESPSVTQWKWAVTWFDDDLANSSDIVLDVVDSCNNNALVARDGSWDFRKRVHLRQASIANKCLVMRATAFKTPASGTVIYSADYFHSGDADTEH